MHKFKYNFAKQLENVITDLRRKNIIVYDYLAEINPVHWARAHFPVPRFGYVTSNIAEIMNSWFGTIRKEVSFKILYVIMNKLTDQLVTYQQMYENIQNPIFSKLQSILNANYTKG